MGENGARLTETATARAERLVDDLSELGEVTARKMFGGYGIFESDVMFVLIDPAGRAHLRADESTLTRFEAVRAAKHGRMPYWSIPDAVLADHDQLIAWAGEALEVARTAKKSKR